MAGQPVPACRGAVRRQRAAAGVAAAAGQRAVGWPVPAGTCPVDGSTRPTPGCSPADQSPGSLGLGRETTHAHNTAQEDFDASVQDCSIYSVLAMEILQSCKIPSNSSLVH